jgi:hypothetical protein
MARLRIVEQNGEIRALVDFASIPKRSGKDLARLVEMNRSMNPVFLLALGSIAYGETQFEKWKVGNAEMTRYIEVRLQQWDRTGKLTAKSVTATIYSLLNELGSVRTHKRFLILNCSLFVDTLLLEYLAEEFGDDYQSDHSRMLTVVADVGDQGVQGELALT